MKSFGKMGQLALSPASYFSSLPWFPGGSSLPHLAREILVLLVPIAPSKVSWCDVGCSTLAPGWAPMPCWPPGWVSREQLHIWSGSVAPWATQLSALFSQWAGWKTKKGKCWLTMLDAFFLALKQHNAVKFCNLFGCLFLFKFWCKMTLLFKIVCSLNNFSFNSKTAGNRSRKLHLNSF